MNFSRIALLIFALTAAPAVAQDVHGPIGQAAVGEAVAPPMTGGGGSVVAPRAATQNTVQTTGPVSSETTISVGSWASSALQWTMTAFSIPIGSILTAWLFRLFKAAGLQVSEGLRNKLQEVIVNGLNAAAKKAETDMAGKGNVEIKNATIANAVAYTQAHGAETIKALGLDPSSGVAVEAIKARIETAINDPSTPTPAILDGATPIAVKS